jgi:hypothetical protein
MNNLKNHQHQPNNAKITSQLTNPTTTILLLTVQMFFELTVCSQKVELKRCIERKRFANFLANILQNVLSLN